MLTTEEIGFYKQLYAVLCDEKTNELFVKYSKKMYDNAIKKVRTKQDTYEYGYNNGVADAWQHIGQLKYHLTEIMKNVG